jgi:hypothetical protein
MSWVKELPKEVIDNLVKIQNILFQKEKGDTLKRESTPFLPEEAQALGDFDAYVNLLGNGIIGIARTMNHFSGVECNTLEDFVTRVFRSSASKGFKRGLAVKEIMVGVKPDINMQQGFRPAPEASDVGRLTDD